MNLRVYEGGQYATCSEVPTEADLQRAGQLDIPVVEIQRDSGTEQRICELAVEIGDAAVACDGVCALIELSQRIGQARGTEQ